MNIILEGCDCVGKTTLAQFLVDYDNYSIFKFNIPRGETKEQQEAFAKQSYYNELDRIKQSNSLVYDRFYLGEFIYAPLLRGYTPQYQHDLENKLNSNKIILAVLTADVSKIKERFDHKVLKPEQLDYVNTQYIKKFNESRIFNKILLDTTHSTPEHTYAQLKRFMLDVDYALF